MHRNHRRKDKRARSYCSWRSSWKSDTKEEGRRKDRAFKRKQLTLLRKGLEAPGAYRRIPKKFFGDPWNWD